MFFLPEPHAWFCMASSCTSTVFRVSRATSVFNIEPGEYGTRVPSWSPAATGGSCESERISTCALSNDGREPCWIRPRQIVIFQNTNPIYIRSYKSNIYHYKERSRHKLKDKFTTTHQAHQETSSLVFNAILPSFALLGPEWSRKMLGGSKLKEQFIYRPCI